MTRQFDILIEERTKKRHEQIVRAVEFELIGALSAAGADLLGFSARLEPDSCLLTLRAFIDDMQQVSFVGSDSLGGCFIKAINRARTDRLKWKVDAYANRQD